MHWLLLKRNLLKSFKVVWCPLDLEVLDDLEQLKELCFLILSLCFFQDEYQGIPCEVNENCTAWLGICGPSKTCALPSLEVVIFIFYMNSRTKNLFSKMEDQFLTCYIATMTSTLEDYLRLKIFIF